MNRHRWSEDLAGFRDGSHGLLSNGRNGRNLLTSSMDASPHSAISVRLTKVSGVLPAAAKAKGGATGMDDLLSSDGGKNDYDWLLTPPETPLGEKQASSLLAPPTARSTSVKPSRISNTQPGDRAPGRVPRSSSATRRPSAASSYLLSSQASKSTTLNTTSLSVNFRPSTPTHRLPATSQSRPATPATTKPATSFSSRPSISMSRTQIPGGAKPAPVKPTVASVSRTTSRPSTPTRRIPTEAQSPSSSSLTVRSPATRPNNSAATSIARSPSTPPSQTRQTVGIPDFRPTGISPNLRTTALERPSSASRSRPTSSHGTSRAETARKEGPAVRYPSPARRTVHSVGGGRPVANGHNNISHQPENNQVGSRIPSSTVENGGFGRTISKKSMDMALRHLDIRNSIGKIHPISSSSLFPQSIRSTTFKIPPDANLPDAGAFRKNNNGKISESGHHDQRFKNSDNGKERSHFVDLITERLREKLKEAENLREADVSVSSRYDSFLLKEDLKNTEWLHSLDGDSLNFDQRFEQLPEPFSFT